MKENSQISELYRETYADKVRFQASKSVLSFEQSLPTDGAFVSLSIQVALISVKATSYLKSSISPYKRKHITLVITR